MPQLDAPSALRARYNNVRGAVDPVITFLIALLVALLRAQTTKQQALALKKLVEQA